MRNIKRIVLSLVLSFCLVFSFAMTCSYGDISTVEAASKKTKATVTTPKELKAALKNKDLKTLVIKTTKDDVKYNYKDFKIGKTKNNLKVIVKTIHGSGNGVYLTKGAKVSSVEINSGNGSDVYLYSDIKTKITTNTQKSRRVRIYLTSGAKGTVIKDTGGNCRVQNHTGDVVTVNRTDGDDAVVENIKSDNPLTIKSDSYFNSTMDSLKIFYSSDGSYEVVYVWVDGVDYTHSAVYMSQNGSNVVRIVNMEGFSDGEHTVRIEASGCNGYEFTISGKKTANGIIAYEPFMAEDQGPDALGVVLLRELENKEVTFKIDDQTVTPTKSFVNGDLQYVVIFSSKTLTPGSHTMTVEAPGYDTVSVSFKI